MPTGRDVRRYPIRPRCSAESDGKGAPALFGWDAGRRGAKVTHGVMRLETDGPSQGVAGIVSAVCLACFAVVGCHVVRCLRVASTDTLRSSNRLSIAHIRLVRRSVQYAGAEDIGRPLARVPAKARKTTAETRARKNAMFCRSSVSSRRMGIMRANRANSASGRLERSEHDRERRDGEGSEQEPRDPTESNL